MINIIHTIQALIAEYWTSIRFKIVFLCALVLLAIMFISLSVVHTVGRALLTDQILDDLSAVAKSRADQVVGLIEQDFERTALVASRTQLRRRLVDFENTPGDPNPGRDQMIHIVQDARHAVSAIRVIDIITLDGTVAASTNYNHISRDDSDSPWFTAGVQGNYQSRFPDENKLLMYTLALPLVHPAPEDNSVIGVIKTDVFLRRLMTVLTDRTGLGETGEIILVSMHGEEITAMNPLRHRPDADFGALTPLNHQGGQSLEALRKAVQGEHGVLQEPDYRGVDTLNAYRHVPVNGSDWGLVVKIDAQEAFAPIRTLQNYIILVGGALLIAGLIAISTIVRYTTDSIKMLEEGTKKMGSGQLDHRIQINTRDELGKLALSFNDMAGNLEKITASRDELEKEVGERKKAEQKIAENTRELEHLYRQLNEEIDKARMVHERILPETLPEIQGLSFAAHYQPAKKVGGDFYNVIPAGRKIIFYLSDVTGHGLEGALLSVFVKECIDSYLTLKEDERSPKAILEHLERQYRRENFPGDYFICIFLAVLDLDSLELTYTGAGFPGPLLVYQDSKQPMTLPSQVPPISSVIPSELYDFREHTIRLYPGTTILMNTDGITEQQVNEEPYDSRLNTVFLASSHLPPEAIVHLINEDFRRFNNGSLQGDDDITFLVMQVDPREKKAVHLELPSTPEALDQLWEAASNLIPAEQGKLFILGLHELTANAMEHGNRMVPEKKVWVDLAVTAQYITAAVEDEGEGFAWGERVKKPLEVDGGDERGRGIALTRLFCDRLHYNSRGNRVMAIKFLD